MIILVLLFLRSFLCEYDQAVVSSVGLRVLLLTTPSSYRRTIALIIFFTIHNTNIFIVYTKRLMSNVIFTFDSCHQTTRGRRSILLKHTEQIRPNQWTALLLIHTWEKSRFHDKPLPVHHYRNIKKNRISYFCATNMGSKNSEVILWA